MITFTSEFSEFGKGWMALSVLRLFAKELPRKLLFRESSGRTVVVWCQVRGRFNAVAATPLGLWPSGFAAMALNGPQVAPLNDKATLIHTAVIRASSSGRWAMSTLLQLVRRLRS